mmetsp:Transcript_7128/g.12602  ORF Transcript_7128/g.12602 Transcript_7128/m.12602 type:complete len:127 (-) Transcript_7128:990-1370(-)
MKEQNAIHFVRRLLCWCEIRCPLRASASENGLPKRKTGSKNSPFQTPHPLIFTQPLLDQSTPSPLILTTLPSTNLIPEGGGQKTLVTTRPTPCNSFHTISCWKSRTVTADLHQQGLCVNKTYPPLV